MREPKKWTLMFYMASDNPLVISIVSQLKAIKAAGYHPDINVIAQFDPYAEGTPTHIFDVNLIYKSQGNEPNIGFGTDSDVRNLLEDKLWRHETDSKERMIRDVVKKVMENKKINYDPPLAPETNGSVRPPGSRRYEPDPYTSLHTFVNFCCEKYPAHHYMLFVLGHGVVVGNDIFLYDAHAEKNSITLKEMGDVLKEFKEKIEEQSPRGTFELVSFNSCSVSSLEVAYELKDTAKYMLASQGPTFVGSWPYREILMRIFNDRTEVGKDGTNFEELLSDIFDYCLFNSSDFLLAGYSYQMTLCDLRRVAEIKEPLEKLAAALSDALKQDDAASKFIILYAHWKAQSFFNEMYTDLYDFCACIVERCDRIRAAGGQIGPPLQAIKGACDQVMKKLVRRSENYSGATQADWLADPIVVKAEFAGPAYQYSHGLSVYFPWTEPTEDSHILQQYKDYEFSEDFKNSWLDFLIDYFERTRRFTRRAEQEEVDRLEKREPVPATLEQELQEEIASLIYGGEGPLGGYALNKSDPKDKTGNDCECPSFKNYPRDTRSRGERRRQAQRMPVGRTLLGDFGPRTAS